MGAALAGAALSLGHEVIIVSGPVSIEYPSDAQVIWVETTQEMLAAAQDCYRNCDGAIGAAAPCDYQPHVVAKEKIAKTGEPLVLHLIETPDVVATLGRQKTREQWLVGFALETTDRRFRATVKLERKLCDLMVSNGPEAINSGENLVELIAPSGEVLHTFSGTKQHVAEGLLQEIQTRLIDPANHLPSSKGT